MSELRFNPREGIATGVTVGLVETISASVIRRLFDPSFIHAILRALPLAGLCGLCVYLFLTRRTNARKTTALPLHAVNVCLSASAHPIHLRGKVTLFFALLVFGLILQGVSNWFDPFFPSLLPSNPDSWILKHRVLGLRIGAVIATIGLGFGAHFFKKINKGLYGMAEIIFSGTFAVNNIIALKPQTIDLAASDQRVYWIGVFGAAYVFARGLNNITEAKAEKKAFAHLSKAGVSSLAIPSTSSQPS